MSDSETIYRLVAEIGVGDVESIASAFLYQGFSPELVLKHLAKIKESKGISSSQFSIDIKTLVTIGVVMGNYNEHNSARISDDGKIQGDALIAKYELKKGSIGNEKKAVTIPRIVATFPIFAVKIMQVIGTKTYNNYFGCSSLPPFMRTGVFPSLIPSTVDTAVRNILMLVCACFTTEQSMVISKQNAKTAMETQKKFAIVSYQSSVPKDDERQRFFSTLRFNYDVLARVVDKYCKETGESATILPKEVMQQGGVQFE